MRQLPPSPAGLPLLGSLIPFARNPLGYLQQVAYAHSGICYFRVGPMRIFVLTDPELIHQTLIVKADKFRKEDGDRVIMSRFLGNGLVTSEGEIWRKQRRIIQPAFHVKHVGNYARTMIDEALKLISDWQNEEEHNVADDMLRLALAIVGRTLFNSDVTGEIRTLSESLTELQSVAFEQMKIGIPLPLWLPLSANRRHYKALEQLDRVIHQIIDKRRAENLEDGENQDVLSMLLQAQQQGGKEQLTDSQLRDEVTTLFVAGHETAAATLTWVWYLLSNHPDIEARLHQELDTVLGERLPSIQDLPQLQYLDRIVKETLRMYPPIWTLNGRQANEDIDLGGHYIPKNSILMISPYVLHHNPRYFPDPETFRPERFSAECESTIPKFAYLPFGGGQRTCIGNNFASMEIRLAVATIAQRFSFIRVDKNQIKAEPLITLRPLTKLRLRSKVRQRVL